MEYLKPRSRILLGSCGIPKDRRPEYFVTLCAQVESTEEEHKFIDISLSREQCESLRDSLTEALETERLELKSDRKLLVELEVLVQAAINGSVSFNDIWVSFWEIQNQITVYVDYGNPSAVSHKETIMTYLDRARQQIK